MFASSGGLLKNPHIGIWMVWWAMYSLPTKWWGSSQRPVLIGVAPGWGGGDRERRRVDSFFLVGPRGSTDDSTFFPVSSHIVSVLVACGAAL